MQSALQIEQHTYRVRQKAFKDWESLIRSPPLVYAETNDIRSFLQFSLTSVIADELRTMVGWAHPDLIFLLKGAPVNLFVDCTFKMVPRGFDQCLILMIYERATGLYIPIFYVLLQGKHEDVYIHAIQNIISQCGWKIRAASFTYQCIRRSN